MAAYIEMPKLSDTMTEGTLQEWLKKEGDTVKVGDVLAMVQTDKAAMELTAYDDGILGKIYVAAGQAVGLGGILGVLVAAGEEAPATPPEVKAPAASSSPGPTRPASSAAKRAASGPAAARSAGGRVKASPLAKKIALERGIDLRNLAGSGPGGRIVRADVLNAPAGGGGSGSAKAAPAIRPHCGDADKRVPVTSMRTIIADRLLTSKTTIPHFYLNIEVDAAPVMKLRQEINAGAEKTGGNKYTVNDFILKAVASACAQVPQVNAAFDGDTIVEYATVNLCVAIAVEDGLVTPVIRSAEKKSLLDISLAVKDLAGKAKAKRLTPNDFAEGTITVSNLGAYGIDNFDAIINPPQAAILSVGAAKKVPVVNADGQIVAGDRMWIGMSCDHRVVDGAVGATWLSALRRLLENPALMLV